MRIDRQVRNGHTTPECYARCEGSRIRGDRGEDIMAKQPESDSFMDMFGKFGRDLKVPNVDVEAILAHHRKNLEALEKAARASTAGATSLLSRQREMLQDTLREVADVAQSYRAPGNPQELMAKQTEFARKSFEATHLDLLTDSYQIFHHSLMVIGDALKVWPSLPPLCVLIILIFASVRGEQERWTAGEP